MEIVLGLVSGLVLFLCLLIAYITGLKHGKQLGKGNIPSVNLNPVRAVQKHIEAIEEKKQMDLYEEGLRNIMSYTGEPQKAGD
jgi:hypothetical protein